MDLYSQGRRKFNLPLPGRARPLRRNVRPSGSCVGLRPSAMLIGETICIYWTFEGVAWYAFD
jgi:hypothetical protein